MTDEPQDNLPASVDGHDLAERLEEGDNLRDLMASNFLEYASYVIRDRAIPDVRDGLKPVQRRILHALNEMDDGRFHKVANVIGQTMQYHPHGDASIGSALIVVANKEYFIDRQGNFGNIYTGDDASAARYIECRLTPLAREVLFNRELTEMVDSYDGRRQEPVFVPAKVPVLLMHGSDGIAVGMSTHILPHNFCELLEAEIAILEGRDFAVYPDFLTAGIMDVSDYDDGRGRVKVRARIDNEDDKTLVIREIPATTTTESLISSIEDAARNGKIKISSIRDYTAEHVEIEIKLPRGSHAGATIKQLYAYTNCEISITSNIVVIRDNQPVMVSVSEVLHEQAKQLVRILEAELNLKLGKLHDRFHEKTLAQIFIENRIYKRIEECESYEKVLNEVYAGLEQFRHLLKRDIVDADIEKLLQLQIRRISRFDLSKNRQDLDDIVAEIQQTLYSLEHLVQYSIDYLRGLLDKFGKDFPRRTQLGNVREVNVREVALRNLKVGHDRVNHFIGTQVRSSNKSDEPIICSEYDRLVLLRRDGSFKVIPVPEKEYVGPIRHLLLADKEQVYCLLYRDANKKNYFAKRFRIDRYIMGKEYQTIPKNCVIEGLYCNYGVVLRGEYKPNSRLRNAEVMIDFEALPLRATAARGFKVADRELETITQIKRGTSESPDAVSADAADADADVLPVNAAAVAALPIATDTTDAADAVDVTDVTDVTDTADVTKTAAAPPPPRRRQAAPRRHSPVERAAAAAAADSAATAVVTMEIQLAVASENSTVPIEVYVEAGETGSALTANPDSACAVDADVDSTALAPAPNCPAADACATADRKRKCIIDEDTPFFLEEP